MIINMIGGALNLMPLTLANTLSTTKNSLLEIIGVVALVIVAAKMLPALSGGKKIAAIGMLVFGVFILAAIGELDTLIGWVKKGFTAITGLNW